MIVQLKYLGFKVLFAFLLAVLYWQYRSEPGGGIQADQLAGSVQAGFQMGGRPRMPLSATTPYACRCR